MADISNSSPGLQPLQDVVEPNEDWYKDNLRFLLNQWNQSINNVPFAGNGINTGFSGLSYVNEYYNNLQYKYGTQVPADYSFFVKDYSGNNTQVPMVRGLDIMKITNYLSGKTEELVAPLPKTVVAKSHSSGALSAKKNYLDFAYFQYKHDAILKAIQVESGFGFRALDRDFKSDDEANRFFENFTDGYEKAYTYMAKDFLYSNDYHQTFTKAGEHVQYGNLGSVCIEYVNGKPQMRLIPPQEAIVDYSKGLDIHINDDYGGEVHMTELTDLFLSYDFTDTEKQDLINKSTNSNSQFNALWAPLNNGFCWFTYNNGVRKVGVVKGEWISMEKIDGGWRKCKRRGVLIGNTYLREFGMSPGQTYRNNDKRNPMLCYINFTPGLLSGTSISIVGTAKRYQDLKDAFITKAVAMAAKAMGKGVIINLSKMPIGMATPEFISQMKQAGVIITEGADTDIIRDGQRMVEAYDLSLDPGIKDIFAAAQYFQQEISDFTDTSPVVRGQQTGYQSRGAINNIQAQSATGRAFYFKGMLIWIKEITKYATNLYKTLAPDDEEGRENLSLLIGDALTELISMDVIREMQFEDFNLDLEVDNFADQAKKQELIGLVIQTASNPTGGRKVLKDYVHLSKLGTLQEMDSYLSQEIFKDETREAEAAKSQQDAAAANAKYVADTQTAIADRQAVQTDKLTKENNATKVEVQHIKSETEALGMQMKLHFEDQKNQNDKIKLLLEEQKIHNEKTKPTNKE